MKQDPPAARGAVKGSTDTRSLEWFLSQSSAILREGEESPQHGLERPICSSAAVGPNLRIPKSSFSWTEARHEHSKMGIQGTGMPVQVALDRAAMERIDLA